MGNYQMGSSTQWPNGDLGIYQLQDGAAQLC